MAETIHFGMNTDLRKTAKNDFEKDFFKLTNDLVFGKKTAIVMKKTEILVNKPVYLRLSILELSKI